MLHRLARLFSIPAGDERRTFLLFLMYLLFFIGLRWGDSASRTLFQLSWGDLLSVVFLFSAPVAFAAGLTYSYFAGRMSNQRLLVIIVAIMLAWLASVQILLVAQIGVGEQGFTYLYFFLGTLASVDVLALHLLNYINDFYNTRSAKQALPFILSASIAASVVAGFSAPFINSLLGLNFIPLAWAACLLGLLGLASVVRRDMPPELAQIERQRQRQLLGSNVLKDFRRDVQLLRQQNILRWLAVSTLVLVLLMKLLTIQSASVFNQLYAGNPTELFNVYNMLDAVFSLLGLLFSALVFNRLIVRYGVGDMSLIFPALTAGLVAAINFVPRPGFFIAALAYLDDRAFKKVFRNPIEAMFYNSVPVNIKARARAFINSITLPLGTLLAGALGLAMARGGLISPQAGAWLCFMLALGYLGISWLVKNAYSRAMVQLVANDELAIFRTAYEEQEESDPLMVRRLAYRLRKDGDNEGTTLVLAEMLYDFQGRTALPDLTDLAGRRPGAVRAGVIQLIDDWVEEPAVRNLCLTGLSDPDVRVLRAASAALASIPQAAQDRTLLDRFVEVVRLPDETAQAFVLPVLIASGDARYSVAALPLLSAWLNDAHHPRRRALGLQVLAHSGAAQLLDQVSPFLRDEASLVRVQAVDVIGAFAAHTDQIELRHAGLAALQNTLADEEPAVRLTAVDQLGMLNALPHKATRLDAAQVLFMAMQDSNAHVRRAACAALSYCPRRELERAYRSTDERVAEGALYVLGRLGSRQVGGTLVQRRLNDWCETLAERWYGLQVYRAALLGQSAPGLLLLSVLLKEQADYLVEQIFWLLGALYGEADTSAVRRSLRSADARNRANAIESLEAMSTPRLAEMITAMHTENDVAAWSRLAQTRWNAPPVTLWQVLQIVCPRLPGATHSTPSVIDDSDLLTATGLYAAMEAVLVGAAPGAAKAEGVRTALQQVTDDTTLLLRETAQRALQLLEAGLAAPAADKEQLMLTLIEKTIFLKQVQFFSEMPAADVRTLAVVSELVDVAAGQPIITEGESGDALYIIVSGRVAVQHRKRSEAERTLTELATLGPREYFGEMSLFDAGPSTADVVALVPTQLLAVRRAPLFALLERKPALTMDLFHVVSRRLRQANELLARRER
jgi:hypothetical protein